jgi:hypothetical protein
MEKRINPVPSSISISSAIPLNIKFTIVLIRTQLRQCLKKRQWQLHPRKKTSLSTWFWQLPPTIKYSRMWYWRRKKLKRTRFWPNYKMRKSFNICLNKLLITCNRNFSSNIENQTTETTRNISVVLEILVLLVLLDLPNLLMLLKILVLPKRGKLFHEPRA